MIHSIDLNADMGEGFGAWAMGDDAALLEIVTSANIACGLHAGDWDVMAATMKNAAAQGVGIGAHPGFPDLYGFGRRRMDLPIGSLKNLVSYQLGAARAMAQIAGAEVRHLKLHGAMANMAAEDVDMARACYEAALSIDPGLIIMVLAGTKQHQAARELGCATACEIFADRAYNDDATLVDRNLPGAVIHDPQQAGKRMVEMVQAGAIITESGAHIPTRIDTICLHGDTPTAVALATEVRSALQRADVSLSQFDGRSV